MKTILVIVIILASIVVMGYLIKIDSEYNDSEDKKNNDSKEKIHKQ